MSTTKTVTVGGSLDDIIDSYDTNKDGKFSRSEVKEIVLAQQEAAKQAAGFKAMAERLKALSAVLAATVILLIAIMIGSSYIANKITQESAVDSSSGGEGGTGKMSSMTGETVAVVPAKEKVELWMAPVLDAKHLKSIDFIAVTVPGSTKKDPPKEVIARVAMYTKYSDTELTFTTTLGKRLMIKEGKAFYEGVSVCAADADCSSFTVTGIDAAAKRAEACEALEAKGLSCPTEGELRRRLLECTEGQTTCFDSEDDTFYTSSANVNKCHKVEARGHCNLYNSNNYQDSIIGKRAMYYCPLTCSKVTELPCVVANGQAYIEGFESPP